MGGGDLDSDDYLPTSCSQTGCEIGLLSRATLCPCLHVGKRDRNETHSCRRPAEAAEHSGAGLLWVPAAGTMWHSDARVEDCDPRRPQPCLPSASSWAEFSLTILSQTAGARY